LGEVAEVGAGVALADHAGAVGVGGELVFSELAVFDVHAGEAGGGCVGEEESVAGGASGDDAVHHVDTHAGVLDDFVGVADAHDVAGFVGGQVGQSLGDYLPSQFTRFSDGEAADGVAVETGTRVIHFDEALGGFAAEVGVHASLDDAEEALGGGLAGGVVQLAVPGDAVLVGAEMVEGAAGPEHGDAEAFAGAGFVGGVLGAFVEGHADVCAEGDLDIHGVLGGKHVGAAVEVGAEADALVGEFAELVEGEDLESAGVCEHGAGPGDELVQSAEALDELVAGA